MIFKKKSKNFYSLPDVPIKSFQKFSTIIGGLFFIIFVYICFQVYVPVNPISHESITYVVKKGAGANEISADLKNLGVIRSTYFFEFYSIVSLQHSNLQAGKYIFSPRMSVYQIVKKLATGDISKNLLVIQEGWDVKDIGKYLESKNICKPGEFSKAVLKDYSSEFAFLSGKPKYVSLEGYLFPDTYEVADGDSCDDIVLIMLENFDKKFTPSLRQQIAKQKKSIFDIVTMSSLLEKEVRTLKDKEIVSGILWKRINVGMPLQLDSTVNYITDRSDPSVSIKATKIDSPYNTYMYKGLPKGPICSPGMDSITAALNPIKTDYWFYLSDGRTIYAKTGEEQAANKAEYLP